MVDAPRTLRLAAGYYALHRAFSRRMDRFVTGCDHVTMQAYALAGFPQRRLAQTLIQDLGSLAYTLKLFPRLDAYRLRGPRWTVVYIGDTPLFGELQHLLFPEGVTLERIGRVAIWETPAAARHALTEADLVVCGLGRKHPGAWRPRAAYTFTCPVFVRQVLAVDRPFEALLRGRARDEIRYEVRRSERIGFCVRATRDRADFDQFFAQLYLPHTRRQHGSRALPSSADDHWAHWVADRGELLLLELAGRPVAGMTLCYRGATGLLGQIGVAEGLGKQVGRSVQVAAYRAAIEQAQARGCAEVVMGRSLARYGDPVFRSKRRWGARVAAGQRAGEPEWTFVAHTLSAPLRDYLNAQELISLVDGAAGIIRIKDANYGNTERYDGIDGIVSVGQGQIVMQCPDPAASAP